MKGPLVHQSVAHRSESQAPFSMAAPHAHQSHTGHPSPTQKESWAATSCSKPYMFTRWKFQIATTRCDHPENNTQACKIGCKITIYIPTYIYILYIHSYNIRFLIYIYTQLETDRWIPHFPSPFFEDLQEPEQNRVRTNRRYRTTSVLVNVF